MRLATATEEYNENQGDGIFKYVLIFFAALIISGFLASAAIRSFQSDATHPIQVSPLVRVSPLEVAITEAAVRPFATDPVTPYREELREAVVLDSKITAPVVSGISNKTDPVMDATPVEISKPKAASPVAESHVRRMTTVRRKIHPVSSKLEKHSAGKEVLLASVGTPVASTIAPKAAETAPITATAPEIIHDGPATDSAVLKPVENTPVASIAPSPVNTGLSVANSPAAGIAPAEKKNSVSDSSSVHSPLVSPFTTGSEVKETPADTSRNSAASGISKEEKTGKEGKKEDKKEDGKKGLSALTIIEWTLKIVGFALVFLK